jgi:hypothetical protein
MDFRLHEQRMEADYLVGMEVMNRKNSSEDERMKHDVVVLARRAITQRGPLSTIMEA